MKDWMKQKAVGFYLIIIAAILAIVSIIRFGVWAPVHNGMDTVIIAALVIGIVLDLVLAWKDNSYVMILSVVCYAVAGIKLLTNSVGAFVDAIQGINMFGDSSQVSNILSISIMILVSALISILASYMKRVKN